MQEPIEKSRRAMEEEFFARQNKDLLRKLKAEQLRTESYQELTRMSGIKDRNVLDRLLNTGISASTLVALANVPLVLIAWADGVMNPAERTCILEALENQGLDPAHSSYDLMAFWLNSPPGAKLFDTWKAYVQGLREAMDRSSFELLKLDILHRTMIVAESAGGFLGLGSKISGSERERYRQLEEAFAG